MNSANVLNQLVNLPVSKSVFSEHSSASKDDLPKAFKGDPAECQTSILSIIEAQIIPRLLKAERAIGTKLTL